MTKNGNATNDTLAKKRPAMDRFLIKLRDSGNVRLSCQAAGVPRKTIYRWRHKWATFAAEWQEALDDALDLLEGMAWKRALVISDRLLMFLLKAHRPKLYNPPQQQEISGKEGKAIVFEVKGINLDTDL